VGGGGARVIRLGVRVPRERAELVAAELLALSPGGLEEVDLDGGVVELAIYGAAGELADLGHLRAVVGDALVEVVSTEVPDDWSERWRDWHRPLDVGPLRVRPPWEPPRPGALDVVIDPGQAFGTGAHPSPRLSLELLCGLPSGGPLADWGCGSGVLALAAARLGFDPILACDHDPASVDATLAAAETNGIAARRGALVAAGDSRGAAVAADDSRGAAVAAAGDSRGAPVAADSRSPAVAAGDSRGPAAGTGLVVSRCDLRRAPGPWAPAVTANLVRPLLLEVAGLIERPPERLIASGLEVGEAEEVAAAFARHGLRETARREGEGWSAILLAR
jgi:ribosomal protein L11 methyltransferase